MSITSSVPCNPGRSELENPEVRQDIYDTVNFWLEKGVKGLRFDVINLISKPDVYEDDLEGDGHRFYTDGPKIHQYLQELNENTLENMTMW